MKKNNKIEIFKIVNSKYFIPQLENNWNIRKESWFDIQTINYNVTNKEININKDIKNIEVLRTKQIQLYLNKEHSKLIKGWIEIARIVYNLTVYYFRQNELISFRKLRPIIKNLFNNNLLQLIQKYKVPFHIITNAIADVCKNYKSAIALLKIGEIKYFKIRYKKINKPKQSIVIERQNFAKLKNSFYIKTLGIINSSSPINQQVIKHDSRLSYYDNKFILNIPEDRKIIKPDIINKVCGIDPGNKSFLTIYNPEGECIKIANRDTNNKLMKLIKRKVMFKKLTINKDCSKYRKATLRNNKRIRDLVKELHYKSARYICKNFEVIYLGKLSTKAITTKKGNMSKLEKLFTYAISHDTFRTIIKNKAEEFNQEVKIVPEHYTSMTCGNCGNIKVINSSREYNCSNCKINIDRDLNGARNILIKNT